MIDYRIPVLIFILIILLVLSAYFSGSEIAIISQSKIKIKQAVEKGNKQAKVVEELLKKPDRVIGGILIGNNIVNVFASIIAGYIFTLYFGGYGIGIATAVMTFIILIFCEFTPKALAMRNEHFAYKTARSIDFIVKLLSPIIVMIIGISDFFVKKIRKRDNYETSITEQEIKTLLKIGEEEGTIQKDERKMIYEVFDFDETKIRDVMVPKNEIVCLSVGNTIEDALNIINQTGYSRIPIYEGNINNFVGVVHIKDIIKQKDTNASLDRIMLPILKVKTGRKADELLREMQKKRTHLAIVVNNKNETVGMVTMEDLIEEIVGEIKDEYED